MPRTSSLTLIGALPLVTLMIGCGGGHTTASKSAAEFDEAQRKGVAPGGGEGHGEHGQAADAQHPPAAGNAPESAGMGGMDHSGMSAMKGSPPAGQVRADSMPGMDHSGMAGMGGAGRPRSPAGHSNMAAMDHSRMPARSGAQAGHPGHATGATGGGQPHAGHVAGATAAIQQTATAPSMSAVDHSSMAGMDHSQMGHAPGTVASRETVERPAAVAVPGQPAATLRPDGIDSPAPTAVREAARSAEMAAEMAGGGHGMQHGTYSQVDAGREDVTSSSPRGHEGHGAASPTAAPSADPHRVHTAPPTPQQVAPTPQPQKADPHAGHSMPGAPQTPSPSPGATPSPRPKEDHR